LKLDGTGVRDTVNIGEDVKNCFPSRVRHPEGRDGDKRCWGGLLTILRFRMSIEPRV
jgi:hypothetical protein